MSLPHSAGTQATAADESRHGAPNPESNQASTSDVSQADRKENPRRWPMRAIFGGKTGPLEPNDSAESHPPAEKHRWMTALADKLWFGPGHCNAAGENSTPTENQRNGVANGARAGASKPSNLAAANSSRGSSDGLSNRLGETQIAGSPYQPTMTFTYAPGSRPFSPYTIRRGVGVGGFGEVYFALSDAGKEVALKRIQRNLEIELRGVSQCLNLKHPHLVALYDIARDETEQSWVVMEYVAGPNLREVLDQSPTGLPADEVHRWFSGIAAGVNHLHSAGLVHRDLKPGNVFDDLGVVKVGDYGLSKYISSTQRGGHTESVGTFHYMAPEIGRGQYGREIDIYAMGVILHELLTGNVPFDGESCHEIIVKHMTAQPDLSHIGSPYREVVAASLEKDPANRPASIGEMLSGLGLDVSGAQTPAPTAVPIAKPGNTVPVAGLAEPVARVERFGIGSVNAAKQNASLAAAVPFAELAHDDVPLAEKATRYGSSDSSEPLARAVRKSAGDLKNWWGTLDQSPTAKWAVGFLIAFVLLVNTSWLVPALSLLAVFYVPYYIGREMILHARQQPSYAQAQRLASSVPPSSIPQTKQQWRGEMRSHLRAKHSAVRVAELSTSWLAATGTVTAMTVGAGVIGLPRGDVNAMALAPYGWMAVVVLLGSLGILGMGKLWERDEGEALPRRLVLAGVGAGVGLAAYAMNNFLYLPLEISTRDIAVSRLPQALYDGNQLRASGMMAHFAFLFAAIRWWKPVDPLRTKRLALWNVAVVCVIAWVIQQFLPIPQPYGLLTAGGMAIAVQMAAPWINPRRVSKDVPVVSAPPAASPQRV